MEVKDCSRNNQGGGGEIRTISNRGFSWLKINHALVLAVAISGVTGQYFLFIQKVAGTNFVWDAWQYRDLAFQYAQAFLGAGDFPADQTRTSSYPILLLFTLALGKILGVAGPESVFMLHLSIWWVAISYTHFSLGKLLRITKLSPSSQSLQQMRTKFGRNIVVIILGLNIFVSPYLSVGLTDSIYTSLTLMFVVWATRYASNPWGGASIFTGLLLASLALVIRPAAIWLFIPLVFVFVIASLGKARVWNSERAGVPRVGKALFLAGAASLPIIIQSSIQYLKFGVFSPLPAGHLGLTQVVWGVEYVKYATWFGDGEPQNYYPSEELIGPQTPEGISWYLQNLFPAIQLLTFKLIGAFDFDFLVPYPTEQSENSWVFGSVSLVIFILGLTSLAIHIVRPLEFLGPKWLPLIIFLSWSSIHLLSAVEIRFSLPMVLYFSMISIPLMERAWKLQPVTKLVCGVTFSIIFTIAWFIAAEVRSYSVLN